LNAGHLVRSRAAGHWHRTLPSGESVPLTGVATAAGRELVRPPGGVSLSVSETAVAAGAPALPARAQTEPEAPSRRPMAKQVFVLCLWAMLSAFDTLGDQVSRECHQILGGMCVHNRISINLQVCSKLHFL
jgi:hypothetical protein